MSLLHSFTNEPGMICDPPYSYWLDHALLDRRGANLVLNGHYLGALEDFTRLLSWMKEPGWEIYQERADQLRSGLQTHFWDGEKQLFSDAWIDGERSGMFSEQANAMALAMRIATDEQARAVAEQLLAKDDHNYILRESGIIMATPAMSYFLHKGLCGYGYIRESLEMFRNRFGKMLAPETNRTLWEEWWLDGTGRSGRLQKGRTRSDAQTESAFPPALFAEYILGVKPVQPGMKRIVIRKMSSGVRHIEAVIPSPQGEIFLEWNMSGGGGRLSAVLPDGIDAELDLESLNLPDGATIKYNGKDLETGKLDQSLLHLTEERNEIVF
jgi:hypothetical protein